MFCQVFDEEVDLLFREHRGKVRHRDRFVAFYDSGLWLENGFPQVIGIRRDRDFFAVTNHGLLASRKTLESGADQFRAVGRVAGAAVVSENLRSGQFLDRSNEVLVGWLEVNGDRRGFCVGWNLDDSVTAPAKALVELDLEMVRGVDPVEARFPALFGETQHQHDDMRLGGNDILLNRDAIDLEAKRGGSGDRVAIVALELNGFRKCLGIADAKRNFGGVEGLLLSEDLAAVAAATGDLAAEVEELSVPCEGRGAMEHVKGVVESAGNTDRDHARERSLDDAALHENAIRHHDVVRLLREKRGDDQS